MAVISYQYKGYNTILKDRHDKYIYCNAVGMSILYYREGLDGGGGGPEFGIQ